jgi:hypothetical protein
MLKLYTDFQAVDADGACFVLKRDQSDAEHYTDELQLSKGDKVVLDAHEGFEVLGTLDYKFVQVLGREAWVAYPDWSTRAAEGCR